MLLTMTCQRQQHTQYMQAILFSSKKFEQTAFKDYSTNGFTKPRASATSFTERLINNTCLSIIHFQLVPLECLQANLDFAALHTHWKCTPAEPGTPACSYRWPRESFPRFVLAGRPATADTLDWDISGLSQRRFSLWRTAGWHTMQVSTTSTLAHVNLASSCRCFPSYQLFSRSRLGAKPSDGVL